MIIIQPLKSLITPSHLGRIKKPYSRLILLFGLKDRGRQIVSTLKSTETVAAREMWDMIWRIMQIEEEGVILPDLHNSSIIRKPNSIV